MNRNNSFLNITLKASRKIVIKLFYKGKLNSKYTDRFIQIRDEQANDLMKNVIRKGEPAMVAKFGTTELNVIVNYLLTHDKRFKGNILKDSIEYVAGKRTFFFWPETLKSIMKLSGFFPEDPILLEEFVKIYLEDSKSVDVLGSYLENEKYLSDRLAQSVKINLEGYYCPFIYDDPWTKELKGKKVLVVHPFTTSIKNQYARRDLLFANKDVLPDFELYTVTAVQTIAGEKSGFNSWLDALNYMKAEIDKIDFDVALIGCGAYAFPLCAHVKRKGKIAVHLAGWTQMLFGVYGNRWLEDQPEFKAYINENWVKPGPNEVPTNFKAVENGAYW